MERIFPGNFDEFGFPYLDVYVCNKKEGHSSKVKAIIDTGAAHCMIKEELAIQLKLPELRIADYLHPVFGSMPIREYIMDLQFENDPEKEEALLTGIRAGTIADTHYPASVIIGVEVLKNCRFEYDGTSRMFKLIILID